MEDELERNMTTLFEINKESKKNNQMDFKMVYLCIPYNKDIVEYVITEDNETANMLASSEKKEYKIQVFTRNNNSDYAIYKK